MFERGLKSLEDQAVILVGNYNKISYDRTLWYALVNEAVLHQVSAGEVE